MIVYDVGDIVCNTHYSATFLILKKKFDTNGLKNCVVLMLTDNVKLGNKAGEIVTWAGWPNSNGPWVKVA